MKKLTTSLAAVAAIAAIATTAACSSSGGSSSSTPSAKAPVATIKSLKDGVSTSVALDPNFLAALKSLKLTPGTVGKATLKGTSISFPITGGHVTVYKKGAVTPYVQGVIDHQGSGLSLTAGGTTVSLTNFVVNPGNHSNLTGDVAVNGKSAAKGAKLFDLDGTTLKPITINSAGVAKLTGTRVLLSSTAAGLLDKTFNTTAVKPGLLIGVATILANSK